MKFFVTETEAIRVEAIIAVDTCDEPDDGLPVLVTTTDGKEWFLPLEDGQRLLRLLRYL
jgi:hypothetical protein